MATKRMYSTNVIDSDEFLNLPMSAQYLYFHLGMKTDDDGFVLGTRRVMKYIDASEEDLNTLIRKGFLIEFPSKVYVMTHFHVNNTLKNDRYHPTIYQDEYSHLGRTKNNEYYLVRPFSADENEYDSEADEEPCYGGDWYT